MPDSDSIQVSTVPAGRFVTGATGFIGRHLVARLLERSPAPVYVLVREASRGRFEKMRGQWSDPERVQPVYGDLSEPALGLSAEDLAILTDNVEHFFHVGALYDMKASDEALEEANVAGTNNAVDAAERIRAARFHHVSSIAAAGRYDGTFREDMFDEATGLEDPYFRTKHESERVVRSRCPMPWRIYRPAIVVGHSETGVMDKVDGPYYFFPLLERLSAMLPPSLPLPGIDGALINIVPVDFIAAALDHIACQDGFDGETFHLVDPATTGFGDVVNTLAKAAGAPSLSLRVPGAEIALAPIFDLIADNSQSIFGRTFEQFSGIPPRILGYVDNRTSFDCRRTTAALAGSGITVPALETYADKLWQYWSAHLNTPTHHDRRLDTTVAGRRVLITGASSGIGRAAALKLGAAGAHVILVARDLERLAEVQSQIESSGGIASIYAADLSDSESAEALCERVVREHGGVDILVNNAGRSIRRSLRLSVDRFHDFERTMAINYFGALRLIVGFLPAMRQQGDGHIVNVSSIGTLVGPPRFSAYVASKAALEGFVKCAAPELVGDGIDITTIHMPLVKTEMIAPTNLYRSFSVITAAEAADIVCDAIVRRPKRIASPMGVVAQVSANVAPAVWDVCLHVAYRLFPDSTAAGGRIATDEEEPKGLGKAFVRLLPGVYW